MSNPDVSRIARTIGRGARSELYRWMWDNYDEVKAARIGRPDWVGAAAEFAALKFTGRGGKALTPDMVRQTWRRVEAGKAAVRSKPPPPTGAAVRPRPDFSPPPDDDEMQLVSVKRQVP